MPRSNPWRVTSTTDIFLTSRFFVVVPEFEYYKDEFKNVKHRASPGAGVGYEFVRNPMMELYATISGGYQYTEFEGSSAADSHDFTAKFGTMLDFDFPRGIELDNTYSLRVVTTDLDQTNHHFESVLSFDVWGPLEFDLSFTLDRIESPEGGADSNDIYMMAGLSIDF